MASPIRSLHTEGTKPALLTLKLNDTHFTIPRHHAPNGSVLDTEETHIDLTFILPIYLGSLLPDLFSAYLAWLDTHDATQLIKDESSATRVTKATMLLQIGAALGDEEFRVAMTRCLKVLYREYDEEFGPVPKPCRKG